MQAGNYSGTLTKARMGYAQTGNPQVELIFNVTHYQDGSAWAEIAPTERTLYLSMSGKAKPYTQQKLEACGFSYPPTVTQDPETNEALLSLPQGIADDAITLTCKEEFKPDGSPRESWDLANWGGAKAKPVTEEDIMRFKNIW